MTKLAQSFVVLAAIALAGLGSTGALADKIKDTGGYDAAFSKRDALSIPGQEGHELVLAEANGTATSPGRQLDGFSVSEREIADLIQGNGPQQGYVIFSKSSDQQTVRFEGNVTTTLKDGQPNTTMRVNTSSSVEPARSPALRVKALIPAISPRPINTISTGKGRAAR
jgi:hypothetical protein